MMFPMGTYLKEMLRARLDADAPLNGSGFGRRPRARAAGSRSRRSRGAAAQPAWYRRLARMCSSRRACPAPSALLLGQKLPGASGGYVHAEHLIEHLRPHAQALETKVVSARK